MQSSNLTINVVDTSTNPSIPDTNIPTDREVQGSTINPSNPDTGLFTWGGTKSH